MREEKMTDTEKAEQLIRRVARVEVFTRTFNGRWTPVVESSIYQALEVYQSRPAAIWRYFRFAVRHWKYSAQLNVAFYLRLWLYRLQGQSRKKAIERICETFEGKFLDRGEK